MSRAPPLPGVAMRETFKRDIPGVYAAGLDSYRAQGNARFCHKADACETIWQLRRTP